MTGNVIISEVDALSMSY